MNRARRARRVLNRAEARYLRNRLGFTRAQYSQHLKDLEAAKVDAAKLIAGGR